MLNYNALQRSRKLDASLASQLQGAVRYKEQADWALTGDVFSPSHQTSGCIPHIGPPPGPWRNNPLLWYPKKGVVISGEFVRHLLVTPEACGLLLAGPGDSGLESLSKHVLWSVKVVSQDGRSLLALFFDCNRVPVTRARRKPHQLPPIAPIPLWSENTLPTLLPFVRKDDTILEPLRSPPVIGSQEAKVAGFLPALPVFQPDRSGGQKLPEEVQLLRCSVYKESEFERRLRAHPFPSASAELSVAELLLENFRSGSGLLHSFPEKELQLGRREANNNASSLPHQDSLRATFMSGVVRHWLAGPYKDRPPYPNQRNPHQAIVTPLGAAVKGHKWQFLALDAMAQGDQAKADCIRAALGKKVRPTFDGAAPHDPDYHSWSVNSRLRGDKIEQLHTTVATLIQALLTVGPEAEVLEFDVKTAFNTMAVRLQDLHAFVQKVVTEQHGTEYFTSLVNVFGTTDAPPGFASLAVTLWWILQSSEVALLKLMKCITFYVDNFWGFLSRDTLKSSADETLPSAKAVFQALLEELDRLGPTRSTVP
jgi:hypothetical protein